MKRLNRVRSRNLWIVVAVLLAPSLAHAKAEASQPPSASLRRPSGVSGTAVVPSHFLRRWDPVTVFFSGEVGPEGGGPEDHPEKIVTFEPDHPGAFTWVDRSTLQFRPAEPWPPLSRFTWRVEGKRFVLTTLMAAPVDALPARNAEGLERVDGVTLTFPESMEPAALARMVTIELRPLPGIGKGEARWLTGDDFQVKPLERTSRSDTATYVLSLNQSIPLGTRAVVHLRLSLDDDASQSFTRIEFSTAEPFRATRAGCRESLYPLTREGTRYTEDQAIQCASADRSFLLQFSSTPRGLGPVEARNLVRFTPPVGGLEFSTQAKTLAISGNFAWETLYRVDVTPVPLTDDKGRELEMDGESALYIYFPRLADYLKWGASQGVLERHGPRMVPIEGRAEERVDLRFYSVDPLDRSFWPFPEQPIAVDESARPPGPGEEPSPFTRPGGRISAGELARQISALGSPPVSTLASLPLRREGSSARFGLDLEPHLTHISGKDQPGTYLVGIRRLGASSERSWMRIQVTDLSLSTVEERAAVRFVVTSLSTGRPVQGATVRMEGTYVESGSAPVWKTLMEESTDAEGAILWPAPGDPGPGRSIRIGRIVVEKAGDTLVLDPAAAPDGYADNHWSASDETWLQWAFQDFELPSPQTLAHIFTERPVYRPEETVHIKGYLRERGRGRLSLPAGRNGNVIVEGPGELAFRYPVELTETGSFYLAFSEEKLPTGVYSATFEDGEGVRRGRVSFRMEAYRLPRFEVLLHGPDRVPLDREFEVTLSANYYAGGRVAGRPVNWRVTQFPYTWTPKRREGFLYSSDGRFSRTGEFQSSPRLEKQDTTDDEGSSSIVINPAVEPTAEPRSYVVEATVIGADDQTVSATRQVIALPPFVLGLKVPRFIERAREIAPEIIVVGPGDDLIADQDVTVRLLLRQWHSILRASDFSDGVARYTTDVVDEKVFETTVRSGQEPVAVSLPVSRAGVYIVELEAHDRLDRAQVVAVDLYAGGDEPVTWSKPVNEVFTVAQDKEGYDPGETAALVLESPFQNAEALAVVEGPERNTYQWVSVRGGAATFRLPIDNTFVPRVPVHFVLMRGRLPGTGPAPGNRTDVGKPATMAATAWVEVNPVDNRVEVELGHPEKALPGEAIEVEIRLTDPKGSPRPGEVTLWLVDQAVLALGKEQRLDPLPDFITPVHSSLAVRDTRNMAFGFLPLIENPGGGEGEEEAPSLLDRVTVRRNFQPVPYYEPAITVGPDGVTSVTVQLPDNLTNFKLRAKAVSGADRFGYAVGTLAVRLPVLVQPALPRFVRPGDRFTAAAIGRVVEGEGGPGSAEIQVEGLDLEGEAARDITWVVNRPERIEFPVAVPTPPYDSRGELTYDEVTFRVGVERSSDKAGDAFEVNLPVKDDRLRRTERLLLDLAPGNPAAIPEVSEPARPGTVRRSVLVSDQPALIRMAAGLDFLLQYPYGCTEQRISRARAQIALKKFRDLLGQADPEENDEELERVVLQTQEWIAGTVDPNELVAYWPGGGGYVSLTAWVVQFLVEAREAGFPVDEELTAKLTRSLEQALRSDYSFFIDGESYAERSWALSALASAGRFNSAYAGELARRAQYLDLEGLAQVIVSFGRAGQSDAAPVQDLSRELWDGLIVRLYQGSEMYGGLQRRRETQNALILPSETRTVAEMTRALVKTQPSAPRLQVLLNALVTLGRGDGWGSTNANASALLALSEILTPPFAGSSPNNFRIEIDGESRTLSTGPDSPVAQFVSTSSGPASVTWAPGGGSTPVGLRAETSYIPAADGSQVAAESNGFVVTRELLRLRPEGRPPERLFLDAPGRSFGFRVSDIVEEHLQVVNPKERHYVAVVIPLAAGMEPLNPNLATAPPEATPSAPPTLAPTYVGFMDDHVAYYYDRLPEGTYDFYFRTRATIPGSFIQPAARAEMMYDGAVTGHSHGARVDVAREDE